jgi:hypothetical protein
VRGVRELGNGRGEHDIYDTVKVREVCERLEVAMELRWGGF